MSNETATEHSGGVLSAQLSRRDALHAAGGGALLLGLGATTLATAAPAAASDSPVTRVLPPAGAAAVRPFEVHVPTAKLVALRHRITATRWPSRELVTDRSQGVQLATAQALARYWATRHSWRAFEAKLNALPQFTTVIDGVDTHFVHVRSRHENALPLIMTHGWPGSVVELRETVGPLTDPTAHGGRAEDAFDLVLPSIPGYGFSSEPTEIGWDPGRTARAWAELMRRLGYTRYVAQGGDVLALGMTVLFLRIWRPPGAEHALRDLHATGAETSAGGNSAGVAVLAAPKRDLTRIRVGPALLPYAIIVGVFAVARLWEPVKTFLTGSDVEVDWPGLRGGLLDPAGRPVASTVYKLQWLSSPGTLLLICGILVVLVYRTRPAVVAREYVRTAYSLRWPFLTVAALFALAYVLSQSGQTLTIGTWIAGAGGFFAFLAPVVGWLGAAVTGSDTSANALFSTLQQAAGERAGLDPTLLVAANTTGGVLGKMISPLHLTIAATAVGILGREGDLFRYLAKWSGCLILFVCVLVYLQFTPVLSWMLR